VETEVTGIYLTYPTNLKLLKQKTRNLGLGFVREEGAGVKPKERPCLHYYEWEGQLCCALEIPRGEVERYAPFFNNGIIFHKPDAAIVRVAEAAIVKAGHYSRSS
jgi:hypothetical protein